MLGSKLGLGVDNSARDVDEGDREGIPGPNGGRLSIVADLGSSSSEPGTLVDNCDCFRAVGVRGNAQLSGLAVLPSSSLVSTVRALLAATRSRGGVTDGGASVVGGDDELSLRSVANGRGGGIRNGSGLEVDSSSNNRRRDDGNRAGCAGLRVGLDEIEVSSE